MTDAELQRIEDDCLIFPDCISYEQVAPLFKFVRDTRVALRDLRDGQWCVYPYLAAEFERLIGD